MICPDCTGRGVQHMPTGTAMPCPLCGGCGVAHCCEPDAMPEPTVADDPSNAALMRHMMGDT